MRASSLSVFFSTLLSLQQASSAAIRASTGNNAAVEAYSDTVSGLDNAATSSNTDNVDGGGKIESIHRRDDMRLQSLDALAGWLTKTPVRADCFFVTSAHLLGTTVQDISNRAGVAVPRPGRHGLRADVMINALQSLGVRFRVWTYFEASQATGGGPLPNLRGVPESTAYPPVGAPRVMGAAYRRPDGSGHVVIVRNAGSPYRRYVDYQANPNGANATQDARNSRIYAYFAVDIESSSGEFIQNQREAIEQMDIDEELAHVDEPMDEPMDVDRDPITTGVNLTTLPTGVLQRIRDNLLPEAQCAALFALALIHTSHLHGSRSMPDIGMTVRADNAPDGSKCTKLKAMVMPKSRKRPTVGDEPPKHGGDLRRASENVYDSPVHDELRI